MDKEKQPTRKRDWFVRGILVAIIIILLLLRSCQSEQCPVDEPPQQTSIGSDAEKGVLPGMSADELAEHLQKQADENNVVLKINTNLLVRDGECYLGVENPHFSTHDMTVDVYLADGAEPIYSSGIIPPNYHVGIVKLPGIKPGTHDAYATFTFYNDAEETTSKYNVELIIIKEK